MKFEIKYYCPCSQSFNTNQSRGKHQTYCNTFKQFMINNLPKKAAIQEYVKHEKSIPVLLKEYGITRPQLMNLFKLYNIQTRNHSEQRNTKWYKGSLLPKENRICPTCKITFQCLETSSQKHCSYKCAANNPKKLETIKLKFREVRRCKHCQKEFETLKSEPKKFCSTKCSNNYHFPKKIIINETRKCINCDKEYKCDVNSHKRYCSSACYTKSKERKHLLDIKYNEMRICSVCKTKYKSKKSDKRVTCSRKCALSLLDRNEINKKTRETWKRKSKKEIKIITNKRETTNIKKLGVKNPSQSHIIKQQKIKTCLKNHGVKFSMQSQKIQEKSVKTLFKNYGVYNPAHSDIITQKKIQTSLARYGVEHPMKSDIMKNKLREIWKHKTKEEIKFITDKVMKARIKNGNDFKNNYSKISQELFWDLYDKLKDKNKIYFGELNKEFGHYDLINKRGYYYDFVDTKNKKVIEFNGDIWHANPKLFNENSTPNPFKKQLTAKEIWKHDKMKNDYIKTLGYELMIVWETDYYKNKKHEIQRCRTFLESKCLIQI